MPRMPKDTKRLRLLLAAGGTGGHLFPGVAIAQGAQREVAAEVLFVGTPHGIEGRVVPRLGFPLRLIAAEQVRGRSWWGGLRAGWAALCGIGSAWRILGEFGPDLIFSLGGYASGPTVVAAWLRRIPCVLLEPNAIPGLTNRLLGRFARRVCVGFPATVTCFPVGKAVYTGTPVRWRAAEVTGLSPGPAAPNADERTRSFSVLIVGGSAGARRLNHILPAAFAALGVPSNRLRIVHQTGQAEHAEVRSAYRRLGVEAEVVPFIEAMDAAYAAADLVICRAGAMTLAELTALGKPAIFVPYPYAADDHQRANAEQLVRAGAALMILDAELSADRVAEALRGLMQVPARLQAMARTAAAFGQADATARVLRECLACLPAAARLSVGKAGR